MPFRKHLSRILRRVSRGNRSSTGRSPSPPSGDTPPPITKESTPQGLDLSAKTSDVESSTNLVLYGRPSCPYCARVDRVIEELNIEEKITRRLTTYGSEWRTDLRNRTGSTQVPCLFIDGQPMFESLDIIDWMKAHLT